MSNIIKVIYSQDWMDCETCGGSSASSTLIEFDEFTVGCYAMATCFSSDYTDSELCFEGLFDHLGLNRPSSDEYGYVDDTTYISELTRHGYVVEISYHEPDCDYLYEDDDEYYEDE